MKTIIQVTIQVIISFIILGTARYLGTDVAISVGFGMVLSFLSALNLNKN